MAVPPNHRQPDGKHVPSSAPGGPADLSQRLAAHRDKEAGPTVPPGGYPQTVGVAADPPAAELSSDTDGDIATAGPEAMGGYPGGVIG